MAEDSLKVRIRFKETAAPVAGEGLAATPVDAHEGGGTYVLKNNAFYAPFALGDLVLAELDGLGMLQVTDVVQPAPVLLTSFQVTGDHDSAQPMADRWRRAGAGWSEEANGLLSTVWEPGVDEDRARAALEPDLRAGRGELLWVAGPELRSREAQTVVDFELDPEGAEGTQTSYWAPDDPFWGAQGLDSPDFLAYVQSLAAQDDVVARALEAGDHDAFREMYLFINGEAPW
jgi:hypothetical protein